MQTTIYPQVTFVSRFVSDLGKEFLAEPQDLVLHLGDTAMLACNMEGAPRPKIRWYREDMEMPADSDNVNYIIHPDGVLEISRVQFSDFSRYKCMAENVETRTSRYATISQNPDSCK